MNEHDTLYIPMFHFLFLYFLFTRFKMIAMGMKLVQQIEKEKEGQMASK
jgi:hypothetical protein